MLKENNPTKKQHYIPQVYLRGFSPNYQEKNLANEKYRIYCYDLSKKTIQFQNVPIKTICYKKDFYEVTGKAGEIVLPNYLEKFFSTLEIKFSEFRKKIENKAFAENFNTNCFLTSDEKNFWVAHIIIQILRSPQTLELAEQIGAEIWQDCNDKQLKNIARLFCLPFFKSIKEGDKESLILQQMFKSMDNMTFAVGVDLDNKLITSDKPIYIYSKNRENLEYDMIIFPISSQICLYMMSDKDRKVMRRNILFQINEEHREEIIKSMTSTASKYIYSNHVLNKTEKKYIKEVLKDREES